MTLDTEALSALRKDSGAEGERYQTLQAQRRRRWLMLGAAAIAIIVAVLLLGREGPLEVRLATAEAPTAGAGLAVLNASGYVTARRLATVSSKATGRISEVLFEEGASVTSGQVLARLDRATALAQQAIALRQRDAAARGLAEVEVRLAEALRQRDRARALRPENLVSQSAVDIAEAEASALAARLEAVRAELAVAEAAVGLRNQDLDDLVIRAPFAGVIVSKDAQPGEMVSPVSAGGGFTRTGIATIVDLDSREIEVDVNEAYINRVSDGQRVEAILDAYPDLVLPAHVLAIVPTADRQKATVRVRIDFDQLDPRILPDMGVKVRFFNDDAAQAPQVLVPAGTVVEDAGSQFVWQVTDERVSKVVVQAAEERSGMMPIQSGLEAGAVVVVEPPEGLREGDRVRARQEG